jgi:hypothetical protein
MKKSSTICIGLHFVILVLFGFFEPVEAYVLQGPHLLDMMIKNLGTADRLEVLKKVTIYGQDSGKSLSEYNEIVKYDFPHSFRSDVLADKFQRIFVTSNGRSVKIVDGKTSALSESRFYQYKDVLLIRSRGLLQQKLADLGIDISVTSYGRIKGAIAYIIGARYPDESVPQIWIEKNTFRPIRWIIAGAKGRDRLNLFEVRYKEWRETETLWYPGKLEFYRGDRLVREMKTESVVVNANFKSDAFDVGRLRSAYPQDDRENPSGARTEDIDEFQKKIEELKKMVGE